ncbi:hypothetical protein H6P81_018833 [Aristolochia fimbriata]|uniref:Uncharacterized protein n=1 Tax=Aristolochia fimbriata TaxID=158543 RepID=A0AAV7E3B9_ARIFI|nr:hypothetical protein H6P81_018833 [Aristolochia fimbriata]
MTQETLPPETLLQTTVFTFRKGDKVCGHNAIPEITVESLPLKSISAMNDSKNPSSTENIFFDLVATSCITDQKLKLVLRGRKGRGREGGEREPYLCELGEHGSQSTAEKLPERISFLSMARRKLGGLT